MNLKTQGLIIKETKVGESSRIITILTSEYGKIQAGANGSRNYKSKLFSGCRLFCCSDFVLSKGKSDIYRVVSAEPFKTFTELQNDVVKLSLGAYFCELANDTAEDIEECAEILKFLKNSLYILTKRDDLNVIKSVFELRLMSILGYAPNTDCCAACGGSELSYFAENTGEILCKKCAPNISNLSPTLLKTIKYIVESDSKKVYSFRLNEESAKLLSKLSEDYIISKIEKIPRTLKYYLTISKNMV